MYIQWKAWPSKPKSKQSMVCHSTISQFHLTNLPPYGINRIYIIFSSPLLNEGCINGSAIYTLISICSIPTLAIIAVVRFKKDLLNLGTGTISCEFWYALLITAAYLSLFILLAWMAIQDAKKRRFTAQWTLLCWKILLLLNIIHYDSTCGVKL